MTMTYDLNRFVTAQSHIYDRVILELTEGRKTKHWIWYIFPQIKGLGGSRLSVKYGLRSKQEVAAYLAHPLLYPRLKECTALVLEHSGKPLEDILPSPSNLKFISCMTCFMLEKPDEPIFLEALDAFNDGKMFAKTARFYIDDGY